MTKKQRAALGMAIIDLAALQIILGTPGYGIFKSIVAFLVFITIIIWVVQMVNDASNDVKKQETRNSRRPQKA